MADTEKTAAAASAAKGVAVAKNPAAAPKPKAEPKPKRYADAGTVTLLSKTTKDKEGKDVTVKYGDGTNGTVNPKRASTKSAVWFSNYKDGITIADLVKAFEKTGGSMTSNLDWDIKHEYVRYNPPKAA